MTLGCYEVTIQEIKKNLPQEMVFPVPTEVLMNGLDCATMFDDEETFRAHPMRAVIIAGLVELLERRAKDNETR